jgi:hypothetical protein
VTGLAEVYAWSATPERVVSCHVCTTPVTVGVDAHDAGVDVDGVEQFACAEHCEVCR